MKELSEHRSALMGFAALWIYYFHICPVGLFARWPGLLAAETFFHNEGFCGVDIFLLVSSFGLSYSFSKNPVTNLRGYGSYLVRRFSRIYTVLLPVGLVIGLVDNWSLREFLGKLTGIYQWTVDVYSFLWFVPCILLLYLLAPLYYALFSRVKHKGLFTLIAIGLSIWGMMALRGIARNDLYAILTRVPVFLLGFYFGDLALNERTVSRAGYLLAAAALIFGCGYNIFLANEWTVWWMPSYNALVNLLIAPAVALLLAKCFSLLEQHSPIRPVAWVGKGLYWILTSFGAISFEVYATQEWVWAKVLNSSTLQGLLGSSMTRMQLGCFGLTLIASLGLHLVANRLGRLSAG